MTEPAPVVLAPARRIEATDPVLRYRGAVSLQHVDGAVAPWRVPHQEAALYLPTGGVGRAAMTSGVRVTFRTDSPWLQVDYTATRPPAELKGPPEVSSVDVVVDGRLASTQTLVTDQRPASFTVRGLAPTPKTVELWLPCYSQFRLRSVAVAPTALVGSDARELPRWVHYGCSVSQGRGGASPSTTWTARVAAAAALDLTNLAIGAGCHLQPLFATLLRDQPAELFSFVAGPNAISQGSLNEHSYQPNLIGFVRLIRERHPTTPIVVLSPILAPCLEDTALRGTLTLRRSRAEALQAVTALRRHGDPNVHYVDGLLLFGPDQSDLFLEQAPDEPLHPGPRGHEFLAQAVLDHFRALAVLPEPGHARRVTP